ncbi:PAS domain-containing sensor histidine kinase [Spirosoma koreense]
MPSNEDKSLIERLDVPFALKAAQLGVWELDTLTRLIRWDERCQALFGLTNATPVPYEQLKTHIHPDDIPSFEQTISRAISTRSGDFFEATYRTVGPDQEVLYTVRFSGQQYVDAGGQVYRLAGIVQDITPDAAARQKRQETAELLQSLFDSSADGISVLKSVRDEQGEIIDFEYRLVNRVTEQTNNRTDLVGQRYSVAHSGFKQVGLFERLKEVVETGQIRQMEFLYTGEGLQNWYTTRAVKVDDGVVLSFQDVTHEVQARQQIAASEQRFRSLIEEAPVATALLVGPEMIIGLANDVMLSYWGKDKSVIGKPHAEAIPELAGQPFEQLLVDVFRTGLPYSATASPVVLTINGVLGTYYFDFTYKPLRNQAGEIDAILAMATEVTEQVIAQKSLKESKDQLAFAIEATELGLWDLNPATNRFTGNTRLKEWFGVPPEDEIDLALATSVIVEKDRQRVTNEIATALHHSSGGRYDTEYTIVHPLTGQERIVRAKGRAWFTDDQVAYRFNGTLQDITESRKSEQRLRSFVQSAPFPIGVYIGREMRIMLANQSIMDVWGKGNDVIGKRYSEILPELANQNIYAQLDDVYTTGTAFHAKYQRVDIVVDGKLQPYYFNYSFTPLFDADGQIYGVMNTAAEVTDVVVAKQQIEDAEAAMRGAVELAELAIWSMDVQTGVFSYSPRFMDWLGFSASTKRTDEAYSPVPDEYRQSVADAIAAAIQPGSSGLYENEHPIINRLTGQVRIIHAQAQVTYDASGNPLTLRGTAQDVTQQRQLQLSLEQQVQERTEELEVTNEELAATNEELAATNEELAATNEELMAANEELAEANQLLIRSNDNLQRFAYVASHDLQEPLRKVQQFGDLLKNRYGGQLGDGIGYLERMQTAASRMSSLIRDLLSFSRISTQRDTSESVDLASIVNEALTDLELIIQETGAVVTVGPLPTVQGDPSQLGQLFQNLISNALKFRRPDVSPRIDIESHPVASVDLPPLVKPARAARFFHCISITDNGIGFEEKYLDRIFQVFQRLHGKNVFEGTGIGLAICEKVATNHNGAITASSKPGEGATFQVYLPVAGSAN